MISRISSMVENVFAVPWRKTALVFKETVGRNSVTVDAFLAKNVSFLCRIVLPEPERRKKRENTTIMPGIDGMNSRA